MLSEFELIKHYFSNFPENKSVLRGIGDDAAVIQIPDGKNLVQSCDTLVSGIHFPKATSPFDIGYKALAVNLSDMAAMGAEPHSFLLALTIPEVDEGWLRQFRDGLLELAEQYHIPLVGGDTSRGVLTISITINGTVAAGKSICRNTAMVGDDIFVTGDIGDAALGLKSILEEMQDDDYAACVEKLNRPIPRISTGIRLHDVAASMIDVSDGLGSDLQHILESSGVAAKVWLDKLPVSATMQRWLTRGNDYSLCLAGGDDYELVFTAASKHRAAIDKVARATECKISRIGEVIAASASQPSLILIDMNNKETAMSAKGYQHFRASR